MRRLFVVIALTTLAGCQAPMVRRGANELTSNVPELYYEQVMNNLAIASTDPTAIPWFGVATQGTTSNTRQYTGGWTGILNFITASGAFFDRWVLGSQNVALSAANVDADTFQIAPISDPDKLRWLEAAFHEAVGTGSQDQRDALDRFYKHRADSFKEFVDYSTWWPEDIRHQDHGPAPWIGFCNRRRDVPKNACFVGSHCGHYVYVNPACQGEFRRFVLAILDIATVNTGAVRAAPKGDAGKALTVANIQQQIRQVEKKIQDAQKNKLTPTEIDTLWELLNTLHQLEVKSTQQAPAPAAIVPDRAIYPPFPSAPSAPVYPVQ